MPTEAPTAKWKARAFGAAGSFSSDFNAVDVDFGRAVGVSGAAEFACSGVLGEAKKVGGSWCAWLGRSRLRIRLARDATLALNDTIDLGRATICSADDESRCASRIVVTTPAGAALAPK